ncbi:hypothetical protein ILYODFUR_014795 [Ilyodon furcidens]|uniref:Uncharacterized protein n=1 Tax=Ilyodon furcidens TaxID=33524 RepID=A0ABV0UJ85_9TELE
MRMGMCDCDSVCLFFVSGWVLGCSLSCISVGPPSNVRHISSPPHYLLVVAVSGLVLGIRGWVLWQAATGSLPGFDVSRGLRSLGPWLDLLGRRRLLAGPVGSLGLLQCGCRVVPLGLSAALLWGVAVVPVVVLLGFLCSGRPSDVYCSDLLSVCLGSKGAGLWLLTLAIAYLYGETLYIQARSHSDPQVFRFRC